MRSIRFIVAGTILALASVGTVLAWQTPTLTSRCARNNEVFDFTINLHAETDQVIELSFDNFATKETRDFVSDGSHDFEISRGGTTLTARYASDHNAQTSAQGDTSLCKSVTPSPSTSMIASPTPTAVTSTTPTASATPSTPVSPSQMPTPSTSPGMKTDTPKATKMPVINLPNTSIGG